MRRDVSNDTNNRAASTVTVLPITSKRTRVYPHQEHFQDAQFEHFAPEI
jgi:hypothetical protein